MIDNRQQTHRRTHRKIGTALVIALSVGGLGGCTSPTTAIGTLPPPIDHLYTRAAVAADHPAASEAGLEMLRAGGNAVDATVATSFCLSVVRPFSCGIGGGGFMVIHDPGSHGGGARSVVLNYRETAPAAVRPRHYVKLNDPNASRYGFHASGVPGTVAGLLDALEHYGTLDRRTVLAPAIRAAEEGFIADQSYVKAVNEALAQRGDLRFEPEPWPFGSDLEPGDIVRNPDQARALRLIAEEGAEAFYRGAIAEAIVSTMEAHGGTITRDDLRTYEIEVKQPLRARFRDYEILGMPPPSSGGVAIAQMFGLLERRFSDVRLMPPDSPAYVHMIVEMMKHAFADRAEWLADDAFVDVPLDDLLDPAYLDRLASSISTTWTMQPQSYGSRRSPPDDAGTSHLSVIDERGMAVACTETINLSFGSQVIVPGFGFALNNQMDDFTTIPGERNAFGLTQSNRNLPEPGKRPLSSMSPTIVLRGGRPVLIAGASGGPRIITATFQCLLNCMLYDMTAGESVQQPRVHHQWMPNTLAFERGWSDSMPERLRAFGHETDVINTIGVVQLIFVRDGVIHAASDPRKGGRPAGY